MKRLIFIIIIMIFIIIILINILSAFDFSLLGFRIYRIGSGSMEPTLKVNDVIVIKKSDIYSVGDIISYKDKGEVITHRIAYINDDGIVTKGDANNTYDKPIKKDNILGKRIYTSKTSGYINNLLSHSITWVIIFIVGIFGAIFSTYYGKRGKHAL